MKRRGFLAAVAAVVAGPKVAAALEPKIRTTSGLKLLSECARARSSDFERYLEFIRPESTRTLKLTERMILDAMADCRRLVVEKAPRWSR